MWWIGSHHSLTSQLKNKKKAASSCFWDHGLLGISNQLIKQAMQHHSKLHKPIAVELTGRKPRAAWYKKSKSSERLDNNKNHSLATLRLSFQFIFWWIRQVFTSDCVLFISLPQHLEVSFSCLVERRGRLTVPYWCVFVWLVKEMWLINHLHNTNYLVTAINTSW